MEKHRTYVSPEVIVQEVTVESGMAASLYSDPGKTANIDYDPQNDHINF